MVRAARRAVMPAMWSMPSTAAASKGLPENQAPQSQSSRMFVLLIVLGTAGALVLHGVYTSKAPSEVD